MGGCGRTWGWRLGSTKGGSSRAGEASYRENSRCTPPPRPPAGHLYANDFPPSSPQHWGAVTAPSFFRVGHCSPKELQQRGRLPQAESAFTVFVFPPWKYVSESKVPWQSHVSPLLGPTPVSTTCRARASHSYRCPHTTLGACSNAESDSLRAWGGAPSSITAHRCHCCWSPL